MNSYWAIYLIEKADCILGFSIFFAAFSILAFITTLGMLYCYINPIEDGYTKESVLKWCKRFLYSSICFLTLIIFVPSTRTIYKVFGIGSVLEYVKNSDEAKQLPDNALKAINYYLKEIPKENANKDRE